MLASSDFKDHFSDQSAQYARHRPRMPASVTGWPPERRLIEECYAGIVMPGDELDAPILDMQISWTVADMLGYLRTWSACNRYEQTHGRDPVAMIEERLRVAWGSDVRLVSWPLTLRVSRP